MRGDRKPGKTYFVDRGFARHCRCQAPVLPMAWRSRDRAFLQVMTLGVAIKNILWAIPRFPLRESDYNCLFPRFSPRKGDSAALAGSAGFALRLLPAMRTAKARRGALKLLRHLAQDTTSGGGGASGSLGWLGLGVRLPTSPPL